MCVSKICYKYCVEIQSRTNADMLQKDKRQQCALPPLTRSGPWQLPTHTDSIGAGAIELVGARAPKFLSVGARGHNSIYGAPVKN